MTTWIGTSWKMNHNRARALGHATELAAVDILPNITPFVIPPYTGIDVVRAPLSELRVLIGAQDAHWESSGAWTGAIAMTMTRDAGAVLVETDHSERRRHLADTTERINLKTQAAFRARLIPLLCIGETTFERAAGSAAGRVAEQLSYALHGIVGHYAIWGRIAYEPEWTVGADGHTAAPAEIEPVCKASTTGSHATT